MSALRANAVACGQMLKTLLLLSGDVEQNPGPLSPQQEKQMFDTIMTLPSMQHSQSAILDELSSIRANHEAFQQKITEEIHSVRKQQQALERQLADVSDRLTRVEDNTPLGTTGKKELDQLAAQTGVLARACKAMQDCQDDLESRSRRNNLVFYGFPDNEKETWAQSEEKVISFCSSNLQLNIAPEAIERSHRLGRYTTARKRPVIVKFLSFKEKERVLKASGKLKGTDFGISEDYSPKIRLERQKLIQYAKEKGGDFKLRFNKLFMNGQVFLYDSAAESVVPSPR